MLFAGLGFELGYLLIALLVALTFHEASHALVAYWLGDPTPKKMGRLSLNPFAHLELYGALLILLIGLGWGKPVRIEAENLKPGPKVGMALVAIAGPISNLLLAIVAGIPLRFRWVSLVSDIRIPLDFLPAGYQAMYVGLGPLLQWIVWLSLALAVFNLIPLSPLDGSRLWQILLPTNWYRQFTRYEFFGLFLVMGLILSDRFFGTNILGRVLLPPVAILWRFIIGTTPPFQL
ncbi:MAG: site-2 protease family protein [Chloroflexi bacterium]|nr:site-2 protease family protein [Chloroflexota bacterium]